MIQEADDFRRLVIDDGTLLVIPDDRHGAPSCVLRISGLVELSDPLLVLVAGDLVTCTLSSLDTSGHVFAIRLKRPSLGTQERVDSMNGQEVRHFVDAFERSNDKGTMCPRTSEGDDQVVTARFRWERGAIFRRDGISEGRSLPAELSIFGCPLSRQGCS